MGITINNGGIAPKDPADISSKTFDWDEHLAVGVQIVISTFTITAISPAGDTALTKDNESILSGNRKTKLRLIGGTPGAVYRVDNKTVTNEAPPQTKERSFFVKMADL